MFIIFCLENSGDIPMLVPGQDLPCITVKIIKRTAKLRFEARP
jgi:hypothetical protein